jgi:hypothetical protein
VYISRLVILATFEQRDLLLLMKIVSYQHIFFLFVSLCQPCKRRQAGAASGRLMLLCLAVDVALRGSCWTNHLATASIQNRDRTMA